MKTKVTEICNGCLFKMDHESEARYMELLVERMEQTGASGIPNAKVDGYYYVAYIYYGLDIKTIDGKKRMVHVPKTVCLFCSGFRLDDNVVMFHPNVMMSTQVVLKNGGLDMELELEYVTTKGAQ